METLQLAGSSTQPRDDNGMSLIRLFRDLPFPFSSLMTGWMVRNANIPRKEREYPVNSNRFRGLAFQRWREAAVTERETRGKTISASVITNASSLLVN